MSDPFDFPDPAISQKPVVQPNMATPALYLGGLNDSQRQAVEAVDGPVLVLAGAGTGKTRVLTTRLVHILLQGKARPWEIMAVTFTNRAAREMKGRVANQLGSPVEGWWVGTFHAMAARILRGHAELVGLKPNFTILDTDDQTRLIKQLLNVHGIDDKKWPPKVLLGILQRWKDRGLTPDKVSAAEGSNAAGGKAVELYCDYQERLRTLNAADFGDLLLHCLTLFQKDPQVLARYQRQFRYVLVDEYQDTNVAQYLWLRLLAQGHRNICCVGDDDQSIYSWRGAEVGNILRFEADFIGAVVVRLERNYRSTPHILGAASGLIAHNEGRLGKTLWTDLNEGEKVHVRGVWDGEEEARAVCDDIEAAQRDGEILDEVAILVRAGFQTREFEERLIMLGIPYRVIGGPRFYERHEIRDAIAYFRVLVQPDDDLAFDRIVNVPKRAIGAATMQIVHQFARSRGLPLTIAAQRLTETEEIRPKARRALAMLLEDFERWRGLITTMRHPDLAGLILEETGYSEMWQLDQSIEAPGRLENLKELVAALEEFEGLVGFLEHVSLVMENDDSSDEPKVSLMTLHGSKGLEFNRVFLPGWEDGLFPHQRALDESGVGGLEEERRLAYVGLTRARKRADISFAANRRIYNQWQNSLRSRFIDELPAEHIVQTATTGFGSSAPSQSLGTGGEAVFSGGWGKGARRRPQVIIDDADWKVDSSPASGGRYSIGERVFHQKFGYGCILNADGDKLEIAFEKAGIKKVMDSFVAPV
jgi:DNA helicase-2/ATP-dependent DNA helicase PcrA